LQVTYNVLLANTGGKPQ